MSADSGRFPDHFSALAHAYAAHRPLYPGALFGFLAAQAPRQALAWDCGTGSGQAALALVAKFDRVLATDASLAQVRQGAPAQGLAYACCRAEQAPLAGASADLVTVAQALHWFRTEAFFAEARRVLRPGGVLAVWSYNLLHVDARVDPVINHFYSEVVGPYWPPQRALVESAYRDLEFPFEELAVPQFAMTADWTRDELIGYLGTWSATKRYIETQGANPLPELDARLAAAWPQREERRQICWPLALRAGRRG